MKFSILLLRSKRSGSRVKTPIHLELAERNEPSPSSFFPPRGPNVVLSPDSPHVQEGAVTREDKVGCTCTSVSAPRTDTHQPQPQGQPVWKRWRALFRNRGLERLPVHRDLLFHPPSARAEP